MNWPFWKSKRKKTSEIERLQEEVTNLHEHIENISGQMTKLTRLQFKSGKNIEEKLDRIETETAVSVQHEREVLLAENQRYKSQQDLVVQHLIRFLDELDHVSAGMQESEQVWKRLLEEWSNGIVETLGEMDVFQLNVLGKTFNPEFAESIKAVPKDVLEMTPAVPYQVVEVLTRGFSFGNGTLIRKAKVVTVREDAHE